MQTVVHVTHEAIQKIGGIGAVLQGLLTSRAYLGRIKRNILIGPYWPMDVRGEDRLGADGEVLYSSLDHLSRSPLGERFQEIEREFDIDLVYGRRRFTDPQSGATSTPEILLFDVTRYDQEKLNHFKHALWKAFGIDSGRYEHIWDYEQYVRLARPAIAALHALGAVGQEEPCVVLSHEYMGMPTALAAILEGEAANFRTIFYAHEVAPMRRIVENHPGHDTMFYNVMRSAVAQGHDVEDVFGDQSDFYKHALVKAARFCDNIFCVGDEVLKEMRFLSHSFQSVQAQLAYNGVPCWKITPKEKAASRNKLKKYCKALLKFEPDHIFTHVTRLVPSKGMWRDLRVLEHMEPQLRRRGESAVLLTLSTEVPKRRGDDIRIMEQRYHWPVVHREGLPDLSSGGAVYYQGVQEFNAQSCAIKVVFINQFGWDRASCGDRMPADMEFMDIRKGSDVEFGQSIYEPFGIAQVEPISFGGICVFSSVCGCAGFVKKAAGGKTPNVIVADYTELSDHPIRPEELLAIGKEQRDAVESTVAEHVANELLDRLPRKPADYIPFIERGHRLAEKMSWDVVATEYVLPGIDRACSAKRLELVR